MAHPLLTFHLLGKTRIAVRGEPLPASVYDKARMVLIYLALEGERMHGRDELAYYFWPDLPPDAARLNLRQALHRIRAAIDRPDSPSILLGKREQVGINPEVPLWVDLHPFLTAHNQPSVNDLETAITLYRGEFLAELSHTPISAEFEEWVMTRRERLHRHALGLLERLQYLHEQAGELERAICCAQRHIELEPWDEGAHQRLIRLFALNGQSAAALDQYRACCKVLQDELGVEPSEETEQLHAALRNGVLGPTDRHDLVGHDSPTLTNGMGHEPERRPVTAFYCSIAPIAAPSSMDPEDLINAIRPAQSHFHCLIEQYGGHVVRSHMGGLLAYFGYPNAREGAARLAVEAALALFEARQSAGTGLTLRIGIHTALTVSGGPSGQPDAVGAASAVAVSLKEHAQTDSIVISGATRQLVEGYFLLEETGILPDATRPTEPIESFMVLGPSGASGRIEASMSRLTPLVGRRFELETLERLWRIDQDGRPRMALIHGEPGIGKSRLLHSMQELVKRELGRVRICRCLPEHRGTAFHPLIDLLTRLLGTTGTELRLERLQTIVAGGSPRLQHALPLLCDLLGLEHPAPAELLPQPPAAEGATRDLLIEALLELQERLDESDSPLLLVVEDVHWADHSTLELIQRQLSRNSQAPTLLLLTCRPESLPEALVSQAAETIWLRPLSKTESAQLIDHLAGRRRLASDARQMIVRLTNGIPLFIEEMTRMILSRGTLDRAGQQRLFSPAIPPTLHDLLLARIDNLGEHKHTIQLAATVGRTFSLMLLAAVAPFDEAQLRGSLDRLVEEELLHQQQHGSTIEYQFRHALVQEAAYQSQLKSVRRDSHRMIAATLQRHFPGIVESNPEWLAWHLTASEQPREAIDFWYRAGQRALQRMATIEAQQHFERALQLLQRLDENEPPHPLASEVVRRINGG